MALAQLETALRLYFERHDFCSVITLAGAADEVFGQVLSDRGQENAIENIKRSVVAIQLHLSGSTLDPSMVANRANLARNALKHWAAGQPLVVEFDAIEEARAMLDRAIDNYWALEQRLSPAMERFQRESLSA